MTEQRDLIAIAFILGFITLILVAFFITKSQTNKINCLVKYAEPICAREGGQVKSSTQYYFKCINNQTREVSNEKYYGEEEMRRC